MNNSSKIALIGCLGAILGSGIACADSLSDGVDAYQHRDYPAAVTALRLAVDEKPNDARAKLWLGLAVYGVEGFRPAMNVWNTLGADDYNDWGMTANLLKGFAYWAEGDRAQAAFFLDPSVKRRGVEAVEQALRRLKAGEPVPPLSDWTKGTPLAAIPAVPQAPRAGTASGAKPKADGAPVTPRGASTAPASGRFKEGDEVLVRVSGKLWWPGKVTKVHREGTLAGYYRVETRSGLDDYWPTQVAAREREPSWTRFFVGTWEVRIPVAANVKLKGNDAFRVFTGGMKLPPLVVNADGTYVWTLLDKRVIKGQWKPRPDAPGIILEKGEHGVDWTLYNAGDKSTQEVFKKDVIYLNSEKYTYQEAYRVK